MLLLVLDERADQGATVGELEVHGAIAGDDDSIGIDDGFEKVTAIAALGDAREVRTSFATGGMSVIRSAVTAQALACRQGLEQREAVLGVAAFEGGHPLGELIGAAREGLLGRGEGFLHGRLATERGGFKQFNRGGRDALRFLESLQVLDKERIDARGLQLGERLPGALTASGRAGRSGLGELDESLRRIEVGERADGDHGDLVLLVLGILARNLGEVGRLALEPELKRLGASRAAELRIGDEAGEELIGERGNLELVLLDEFERRTEDVGFAL